MTLVILAAGMGSRYGGLKQVDPITDRGEFIIDFSIFDAMRAGFDKVVFIIKKENYEIFKETVGSRIEPYIKVEYAFQELDKIPEGCLVPEGRVKPWGTAHALLCAKDCIDDNFAVINADDFYGRETFVKLAEHFASVTDSTNFCMIGYKLGKTLTENGTVSRGVCQINDKGELVSITERTKIRVAQNGAEYLDESGEWIYLPGDTVTSMNCWGLTPAIFPYLEDKFTEFMKSEVGDPQKKECYLPMTVDSMMNEGKCKVSVYTTSSQWYGVTYPEDKPAVKESIRRMVESGEYKDGLWNG